MNLNKQKYHKVTTNEKQDCLIALSPLQDPSQSNENGNTRIPPNMATHLLVYIKKTRNDIMDGYVHRTRSK